MRRAARVVTVDDEVRRETKELFGVPDSRIAAIPNGVDRERIGAMREHDEVRSSLGIPSGRLVLVSVGGITWEKDPLGHLRVAARVLRRRDAAHVWVGDRPMRPALQHQAERAGLNGRFVLLGSRADVGDILAAADVLLFASLAERVLELLEDAERRRAMGTAARERCLARFEIGPISRRYLSLYGEVAGR
jgi:glycosyltransferase involved in cell wall biosynthesis